MLNIGPQELLLVLVVALLVVGPSRLPELGRSIGKGLRELRKAQDEVRRTLQVSLDEPPAPATRPTKRAPAAASTSTESAEERAPAAPEADAGPASTTAAAITEAVAVAHETGPRDEGADETPAVTEMARTLGRSLAELRRAREEVQRTFRVDLDGLSMSGGPARAPRVTPAVAPEPAPAPSEPAPAPAPAAVEPGSASRSRPDAAQDDPPGSPGRASDG